ncbi:MAG: hypothetical protein BroJett011_51000 [Chloroflexota bacterium]|nr:MAG: hypothetical protein BroJett011_51000 [Chloroflexota bacterium]
MSTKPLTLIVPASPAQELDSASQEFLVEILERGLRELKIDRDPPEVVTVYRTSKVQKYWR